MASRNIIPPYTPGDTMAMTRLWQSLRDLQRKSTVEVNQLRDSAAGGTAAQNLLGSSWLNPSASDEFTLSTLDAVHRFYLGQTRAVDQIGLLSEMGLVPGDVVSASVEALPTGGQVARVQLVFTHDPREDVLVDANVVLSTANGIRITKDTEGVVPAGLFIVPGGSTTEGDLVFGKFATSTLDNVRIPDLATHVQFNVISDSTSTAGDITWRNAMLNGGSVSLPYSAPPLRSDRETDMVGADTFVEFTGAGASDKVVIPTNAAWNILASTAMTMEVEFISYNYNVFGALLDKTRANTDGWQMRAGDSVDDGFLFFGLHTDGKTSLDDNATLGLGFDKNDQILLKRRHWAITRNTSGVMKSYIDGRLSNATYTNNNTATNTQDLSVGVGFIGGIYYVRIWDIERTQAQLIDDRHTIFADSTTNLNGDWRFNEGNNLVVKNHGLTASTDGVMSGTGIRFVGPNAGALPPFATDAETVTGTITDKATAPSNITAKMSAPGPIGDTTPSTSAFTTLTASGKVLLGDGTSRPIAGVEGQFQLTGLDAATSLASLQRFSANAFGPIIFFGKSRGATAGDYTIVQDNDTVARISGFAADGVNTGTQLARVEMEVDDASPTANSIGGAIVFSTAPGVSANDITEVGRFQADGTLLVGGVDVRRASSLTVDGVVELATITETNTGTDATRAVSPDGLDGWTGSAQIVTVGTLSAGDVTPQVSAASLTLAGKIEIATVTETNTGTDATRAVSPDGLDGWTGSAQVVTVGTLSAGNVTTQVSASSDTLAGRVELATDAETVTGTDTARAITPANATAKMSAPGPIGDTTTSTGEFTSLTANSNNAMEGYTTGRNVIRCIHLRINPGSTPGTDLNVKETSAGILGFNIPSITDGTNIAKSGSSGSFALDSTGANITLDITEAIVGVISISLRIHDINSSSTTEMYFPNARISGANLRISLIKRGSTANVDWTTIMDAGDRCDMYVSFITST